MAEVLISEIDTLAEYAQRNSDLRNCVVQGLDLRELSSCLGKAKVEGTVFLGCHFGSADEEEQLRQRGALIFPRFIGLPYNPYRPRLYSREELTEGFSPEQDLSVDKRIYDHFVVHGVVFAPGSAGTTQEIFMDATQNHYKTLGNISPMVFLGSERYVDETGLYPMLQRLAEGREYAKLLHFSDEPDDVVEFISNFQPGTLA